MTIIENPDWDFSEKGKKDVERHHKKIEETIKEKVRDIISEESIITKRKGKKVRIPIKGLKDYRFRYGDKEGEGQGAGQGPAKPGDTIGKKDKQDSQGQAGDQEGDDTMEVEVGIDYIIELMFNELGLPYIEDKTKVQQVVPKGWKVRNITKVGTPARMHKTKTMHEAVKHTGALIGAIMLATKVNKDVAWKALCQAKGHPKKAIKLIKDNKVNPDQETFILINDDDYRYKQIEPDIEIHSNAVVIAMMDVSGSMTREKKYMARAMLFWMTEFLKKVYDHVEIKFITHTTTAKIVDEDTFFHKAESGGTACHSAYDKAIEVIDSEYPITDWNVYCIHISDGEDWDTDKTCNSIENLLNKNINMLGYVEVDLSGSQSLGGFSWSSNPVLLEAIKKKWNFNIVRESETEFLKNEKKRFLACVIKEADHIYPALKHFLFEPKK